MADQEAEEGQVAQGVDSGCARPSSARRRTLALQHASAFANVSHAFVRRPPSSPASRVIALPQIRLLNASKNRGVSSKSKTK